VSEVAKLTDNVNHPEHYQMAGGIEVIDVIESAIDPINDPREAMCLANVLKYCLPEILFTIPVQRWVRIAQESALVFGSDDCVHGKKRC